ncbi:MAG TPA: ABC transporter permease, partial [Longimicrobiales bacterium]|nr:ABC transporter permease [Longimicrobiales bacterium]
FPLLGVRPALGRFYSPAEDAVGAEPVAVLAHEFWERRFGADPEILGRTLEIGSGRYAVVGVAPPGFTGAELAPVDVWLPLETAQALEAGDRWRESANWWWLRVVARMAPGREDGVAESQATTAHRARHRSQIEAGQYDANAEILTAPIIAARGPTPSDEAAVSRWLAAVALIVLLIACANVANLMLARAVRWRRELAVRVALGVSRTRLVGQLLTESLVLAALGALAALVAARWGGATVHRLLLPDVAFTDGGLGGRLLLFTALATLVTAVLAGLIPALEATRTDVSHALKSGGPGGSRHRSRTRFVLLVAQGALSVVLLVGAGLFVRSLQRAQALDLGFDARRTVLVQLHWNGELPADRREAVYREALERTRRLPATRAAGLSYTVPFWSALSIGRPRVPGLDSFPRHPAGGPYANKVGPGYFEAMGLELVRGRPIAPDDDAEGAAPVAVVSESMAAAGWPAGDALGSCMIFGDGDGAEPVCTEIVGIVEDHRREQLVEEEPHHLFFLNQHHPAFQGPPQALMVGTRGPADEAVESLR